MTEVFLKIVNMSISASWIVLAVLLLRILLKKAPKWIMVLLWGVVAVRLICPFSIESVMSLIPSAETISPEIMREANPSIDTGISIINNTINPIINNSFTPAPETGENPLQTWIPVLSVVWIIGIGILLVYTLVSYWRVRRRVCTAVLLRENVYQSESVVSPFVLGVIKPKIYIPFNMGKQDEELVIAHEQAHINRKDHWWKPLGFLILTLHWFNPFMWLGYVLLCRDIELACDEKVIKELNTEQKADYMQTLLTCSVNRRMIAVCPLAFGEVGIKDRVSSVLNYKKPALWIIVVAIIASAAVAVCFLTNPRTSIDDDLSAFLDMQIAEHHYSGADTDDNFVAVHHKVLGVDKSLKETTVYMWVLYQEYSYENGKIKPESGIHTPAVITAKRTASHGYYELAEYWEPRDGTYYPEDIKEKFPFYLHNKALDSQRYVDEQLAFCENAAKKHFSSITAEQKSDFTEQGNSWQDDFIAIMDKENYLCSDIVADLRGADVKKTEEDDGSTVFVISRSDKNGKDIHNIQYTVKDDLLVFYHYKNYSYKSDDSEKIGKNEAEKMVNSFAGEFIPDGEKLKFDNKENQQVQSLYDKGKVETWYAKDGNREYHIVIDLEKGCAVYYYVA